MNINKVRAEKKSQEQKQAELEAFIKANFEDVQATYKDKDGVERTIKIERVPTTIKGLLAAAKRDEQDTELVDLVQAVRKWVIAHCALSAARAAAEKGKPLASWIFKLPRCQAADKATRASIQSLVDEALKAGLKPAEIAKRLAKAD